VVAKASKKQQLEFNKIMREVIYENEPNIPKGRIDTDTKVLKKDILKKRTPNTDVKLGASHLDINRLDPFAKRVTPTPPLPSTPQKTYTIDPEAVKSKDIALRLSRRIEYEDALDKSDKTPEQRSISRKNHVENFNDFMKRSADIRPEELDKLDKQYGGEKQVAKKIIGSSSSRTATKKNVPKNVNAVPSAKSVYGGNIPSAEVPSAVLKTFPVSRNEGQVSYKLKIKKSAPVVKVAKVTHPPSRPEGIQSGLSPLEKRLISSKINLPPTAREISDASLQSGLSPMEKRSIRTANIDYSNVKDSRTPVQQRIAKESARRGSLLGYNKGDINRGGSTYTNTNTKNIGVKTFVQDSLHAVRSRTAGNGSRIGSSYSSTATIKSIISKSLPIASKIASHPVARVAGRGLEVAGLGVAAYDVGKSGLELYDEAKRLANRPTKLSGKIGTKVPLPVERTSTVSSSSSRTARPKVQSSAEREYKSFVKTNYSKIPSAVSGSQAQRNAEAGAKLRANPNWQKSKLSGVDTKIIKVTPTVTTNKSTKPSAEGTSAVSSSSSRTARKVSTPLRSIVSKRPDQITEDLSFLNPPSFTSSVRKSPVRPIPTRVQMPEQFMSPSMSLASLPRSKSLKELGVSKWR